MVQDYSITSLNPKNPEGFWALLAALGLDGDRGYYERVLERAEGGEIDIFLAAQGARPVGFCLLNWAPKYGYFRHHTMPEIQDLNVHRPARCKGIGRALIIAAEKAASARGAAYMGIGVGLDSAFGPAQRLYVKMGYIPDGQGISYDRKTVTKGEFRPVDENLCLMLVKSLEENPINPGK